MMGARRPPVVAGGTGAQEEAGGIVPGYSVRMLAACTIF